MRLRATLLAATRQSAPGLPGLGGFLFAADTRPSKARSKRWRTGNGEKMSGDAESVTGSLSTFKDA